MNKEMIRPPKLYVWLKSYLIIVINPCSSLVHAGFDVIMGLNEFQRKVLDLGYIFEGWALEENILTPPFQLQQVLPGTTEQNLVAFSKASKEFLAPSLGTQPLFSQVVPTIL